MQAGARPEQPLWSSRGWRRVSALLAGPRPALVQGLGSNHGEAKSTDNQNDPGELLALEQSLLLLQLRTNLLLQLS